VIRDLLKNPLALRGLAGKKNSSSISFSEEVGRGLITLMGAEEGHF
jgi:hypothetical protein